MDREIVFWVLAGLVCGPVAAVFGLLAPGFSKILSGRELERRTWARLWLPLFPAALLFAVLAGWALQEPDKSDERVVLPAVLGAAPFALIWIRAACRALRSLRTSTRQVPAATVGILRPKIFISPALRTRLDPRALRAVEEHEAAHQRHRDPLRLWLAQMAADLQWPSRRASGRFLAWRRALEMGRDEEACAYGVKGCDLAAALLAAACLTPSPSHATRLTLVDACEPIRERVERLMTLEAGLAAFQKPKRTALLLIVAALSGALIVGALYGELLIRLLPGVVC
jgi:Zn-dependent protease with chaperone function